MGYQKAMKVNGNLTDNLRTEKGMRQGCPLSPLLFIFILEVLINIVRADRKKC